MIDGRVGTPPSAVRMGIVLLTGLALLGLWLAPSTSATATLEPSVIAGAGMAPSTAGCRQARGDNASVPGRDAASTSNKVVVVAQHNLWFHGLRNDSAFVAWDGSGRRTSPFQPWIGFYDMAKRADIERQIALAAGNGVDAFSQEWIAPLGTPGSLEADLDNAFLKARNLCRIRWAIFYDLNLRMHWMGDTSGPPNFDDPRVRSTFVKDFVHFATKYFKTPQYLKIDGRPVVEIWATWNFRGSVAKIQSAVQAAREAVRRKGFEVYLVGDEQIFGEIDRARVSTWDATSSFIPPLMGGTPFAGQDNGSAGLAAANEFVDRASAAWVAAIDGVTVLGRSTPVAFQPGFTPQYDDTMFRAVNVLEGRTSLLAMGPQDVRALAETALRYAQPIGSTGRKIIWVGTWNNYPEGTQLEATKPGSAWPRGNTGTAILDAAESVFGSEVFGG